MGRPRTTRFGDPTFFGAGGGFASAFTVPAGETWLLKRLELFHTGGVTRTIDFDLSHAGEPWSPVALRRALVIAAQGTGLDVYWVFEEGDSLSVQNPAPSGTAVVFCFGISLIND